MLALGCRLLTLFAISASLGAPRPAAAAEADPLAQELGEVMNQLQTDDRVSRTYAALALQRIAREQWRFTLFDRVGVRPWQRQLAPALPHVVDLLGDGEVLQWVSADDQPIAENGTTPRREATLALLAVERPAVEALIAGLSGPARTHADQVLRRLVVGGPAGGTQADWQRWWREHETRPLTNERGHALLVSGLALGLVGVVAATVWRGRVRDRAAPRTLLRPPSA